MSNAEAWPAGQASAFFLVNMTSSALQPRLHLGLLGVFPLLILVYGLATATSRFMPVSSVTLVLCCAAVLLPLIAPAQPRLSRSQAWLLALGLIGILFPAGVQWWDQAPASVWWKTGEHLLALVLAGCVMTSRVPLSRLLHVFVASGSLAMILAIIPIWWQGGFNKDSFWYWFGLGNPNQLLNTVGLASLGHGIWVFVSRRQGLPVPRASLVLAWLGVAATIWLAVEQSRRGIVLAGACGSIFLGLSYLWNHHRRVAIAVIVVLAALLLAGMIYGLATMHTQRRSDRALYYLSSIEFGSERWWAGYGHYGYRLIQFSSSDACAMLNGLGLWGLSAHSEPLDAFLDAGIGGLMVCVGVALLTWRQVLVRIAGPDRWTLIFLVGGASVIACIDNAYSRLIGDWWLACLIGLAFHVEVPGPYAMAMPIIRPLSWLVAGLAALATTTLTSSAFMASDAEPSIHIRTVRETVEPDLLAVHTGRVAGMLETERDWAAVDAVLDIQNRSIGPTYSSLYRQVVARRNLGRPEEAVAPLKRLALGAIFDAATHCRIAELLLSRPDLARSFSSETCERAARWAGLPQQKRLELPFSPPRSAHEAATQLAQLSWAMQRQADDPGIGLSLMHITDTFPTSTQSVAVVLEYIISASRPDYTLNAERIARLLRAYPAQLDDKIMGSILTREQAVRLRPFLSVYLSDLILDLHLRRMTTLGAFDARNGHIRVLTLAGLNPERTAPSDPQ